MKVGKLNIFYQMSASHECTDTVFMTYNCIFDGLMSVCFHTTRDETPCSTTVGIFLSVTLFINVSFSIESGMIKRDFYDTLVLLSSNDTHSRLMLRVRAIYYVLHGFTFSHIFK